MDEDAYEQQLLARRLRGSVLGAVLHGVLVLVAVGILLGIYLADASYMDDGDRALMRRVATFGVVIPLGIGWRGLGMAREALALWRGDTTVAHQDTNDDW